MLRGPSDRHSTSNYTKMPKDVSERILNVTRLVRKQIIKSPGELGLRKKLNEAIQIKQLGFKLLTP